MFSVLLICCFAYGFNGLQSYNISSSLQYYVEDYSQTIYPAIVGGVLDLLTAVVIFGGVHRISFITSVIVPIMASIYILGLITMVLFKPRSWCVYCPMGTMTQLICKTMNK